MNEGRRHTKLWSMNEGMSLVAGTRKKNDENAVENIPDDTKSSVQQEESLSKGQESATGDKAAK